MAKPGTRRRDVRKCDPSTHPALRTVSSAALLSDGSDTVFRQTIHNLMVVSNSVDILGGGFAKLIGVTGPQHELLMLIYRANDGLGIGVGELAGLIKLTSAFVATETGKLRAAGLVAKTPDKGDRRRVVLRLTELGRQKLAFLANFQRQVNDVLFGCFDAPAFQAFSRYLEELVPCTERAGDLVTMLGREQERANRARQRA